jgi:hypothetical protein
MPRGTEAKEFVINKLKEAFGSDYIGEVDKKYYVWAKEGGEKIQVALTLTCPKNSVSAPNPNDWSTPSPQEERPKEISKEEEANIAALLERLNL